MHNAMLKKIKKQSGRLIEGQKLKCDVHVSQWPILTPELEIAAFTEGLPVSDLNLGSILSSSEMLTAAHALRGGQGSEKGFRDHLKQIQPSCDVGL